MFRWALSTIALSMFAAASAPAAEPVSKVADQVNEKMVKIFGSGGFRGVVNYSTGILVSPDGHILTVASQTLDTSELIIHLYDGRKMKAFTKITGAPAHDERSSGVQQDRVPSRARFAAQDRARRRGVLGRIAARDVRVAGDGQAERRRVDRSLAQDACVELPGPGRPGRSDVVQPV